VDNFLLQTTELPNQGHIHCEESAHNFIYEARIFWVVADLFWSHEEIQFSPQKSGPNPQTPVLLQHPILQGFVAELSGVCCQ
jgi:hypothetical protein